MHPAFGETCVKLHLMSMSGYEYTTRVRLVEFSFSLSLKSTRFSV